MANPRLQRCLEPGMSIHVGTVDAGGAPSACRAIALSSENDLATITAYVPVATSQTTIANVATTHRMAIAANNPVDHWAIQLKGTTIGARLARNDEAELIETRLEQFADVLERIGVPRRLVRNVTRWPAFAIEMRVEHVFEQTPGPNAGSRIR